MMLCGFKSRWMTPTSCAVAKASAICDPSLRTSSGAMAPPLSLESINSPSSSSITAYGKPSATPTSNSSTMFGWLMAATARASRSNRSVKSRRFAISIERTLIATLRFRRLSNALNTTPMPPRPSTSSITYGPIFVPAVGSCIGSK